MWTVTSLKVNVKLQECRGSASWKLSCEFREQIWTQLSVCHQTTDVFPYLFFFLKNTSSEFSNSCIMPLVASYPQGEKIRDGLWSSQSRVEYELERMPRKEDRQREDLGCLAGRCPFRQAANPTLCPDPLPIHAVILPPQRQTHGAGGSCPVSARPSVFPAVACGRGRLQGSCRREDPFLRDLILGLCCICCLRYQLVTEMTAF